MANNEFYSRIIHKHDIEANWIKAATNSNFIPKQGEIIVYDRDENYDYERIKIGDGTTKVDALPFIDNNSYVDASVSGKVITLTKGDGSTKTLTTQDTIYTLPTATSSTLGGVKVGSNITNSSGTISLTSANVTAALGYTPPTTNTTYSVVSTTADGLAPKRDGSTAKFLRADGTWAVPPDTNTDTNTTYTFATGDSNGQIKVTPSGGSAQNVSVKGLGTAAYTASTAYATAAQGTLASNAMPKSGGTFTGNVRAINSNRNTSGGCLRNILVVDSTGNKLKSTNRIVMYRK